MHSRPRCTLLVGAPGKDELSWEEDKLLTDVGIPFNRLLDGKHNEERPFTDTFVLAPSGLPSKWRSLKMDSSDSVQAGGGKSAAPQTQFLSFHDDNEEEGRSEHLDFLEHSVAVFDDLASSQILQGDVVRNEDQGLDTTIDFSTSLAPTSEADSSIDTTRMSFAHLSPAKALQQSKFTGHVTNLNQIPNADYVVSIAPQTMTVSLIAGLITISPARTVRLKRSHSEMDIIEVIVGDETRAGFTITFWLAPQESQNKLRDDLRDAIQKLRPGDVILLQNVALSCFRSSVYGQSLSKRFARNSTFITVLEEYATSVLPPNIHAKAQRVEEWIGDFVSKEKKATASASTNRPRPGLADALPPDTQD